ncbi:hypothetical protein J3R83DRAFT_3719 [Lanmaoa asiatica]|nr:hypothetical protein J3R83DRAFT_3719 [Lanmaoa asiatica]
MRTDEQILHDKINLPRLMKRLEQSIQEGDWSKSNPPKRETWIKAQAMLQQVRHARLLLKNVELDSVDPTPTEERRYQHFRTTLTHLEDYMCQVEQQLTPPVRRPKPLLPSIRPPPAKSPIPKSADPTSSPIEATLIPAEGGPSPSVLDVQDLLPASPNVLEPGPGTVAQRVVERTRGTLPDLTFLLQRSPPPQPSSKTRARSKNNSRNNSP